MTKLEIACVVCGLIGILCFQPTSIHIYKGFSGILMILREVIMNLCFLAMIILPLYFRLWR